MKRYLIETSVENSEGSQVWFVDAEAKERALERYNQGAGEIYDSQVEVTALGEAICIGETSLDDFGESAASPQQPTEGPAYGIIDPDYARVYTQARIVAWQYGYACVMHGSFTRDLDLLLVPWTDQARDNGDQLLKLIAQGAGLRFGDGLEEVYKSKVDWTDKPHGRKSCSLYFPAFGDRRWVDISVVPMVAKPAVYVDSTPQLHVGNSAFEDWFQAHPRACEGNGIKQMARDAYAAGMGDPLVIAAPPKADYKGHESLAAMINHHTKNWMDALFAAQKAEKDEDSASWWAHEIQALLDVQVAVKQELGL